jgi:hypothetical protein
MFRLLASAAIVAAAAGSASAAVLWNQPGNPSLQPNGVNQLFADFPTFSTAIVTDVVIPVAGWNITSVSINVTPAGGMTAAQRNRWLNGDVNQARLNVFGPAALSNSDDPNTGTVVSITTVADPLNANYWTITASGLNINAGVGGGTFYIGLNVLSTFATDSQIFTLGSAIQNGQSFIRNPGGGFAFPFGTSWAPLNTAGIDNANWSNNDASLTVEGDLIPAPSAVALLGLGGLVAGRRRR